MLGHGQLARATVLLSISVSVYDLGLRRLATIQEYSTLRYAGSRGGGHAANGFVNIDEDIGLVDNFPSSVSKSADTTATLRLTLQ